MDNGEGLELFRKFCKDQEIKADDCFHLGRGTGKQCGSQYKLRAAQKLRKNTHQYAIQLCSRENVFIAWDLKCGGKNIEDFYVSAVIVQDFSKTHKDDTISYNETGGTLPFYLFNERGISTFLNQYVTKEGDNYA